MHVTYDFVEQFQFQYGSIGRCSQRLHRWVITRFNSSMVRLEAQVTYRQTVTIVGFNSSMVRLEVHIHIQVCR